MRSAAAIAAVTFFGWGLNVAFLKMPVQWLSAMSPATAISFVLTVFSFHLLMLKRDRPNFRIVGYCIISLIILTAACRIIALVLKLPFGIDLGLFREQIISTVSERSMSRMSAITSACFLLLGVALLTGRKYIYFSQSLALLVLAVSFLSLLCYLYQVPEFYGAQPILPIVTSTSLCLLLVSLGWLLSHSNGLLQKFAANYVGGKMFRTSVAIVIIIPITLGYFWVRLHWQNQVSVELGIAVLVTSIIVAVIAVINYNLAGVKRQEISRKDLENEFESVNVKLTLANKEMAELNKEMSASNEVQIVTNQHLVAVNNHLENALKTISVQKEGQLNRILNSTTNVAWSVDLRKNKTSYVSQSIETVTGISVKSFLNDERAWENLILPEDREVERLALERLEREDFAASDYRISTLNKFRWMNVEYRIIRDDAGTPLWKEVFASDITSKKESETALKNKRNLMRSIIDNIPDVIYVKDFAFRHIISNKAFVELLGASTEQETLGKTALDYFDRHGTEYLLDDLQVLQSGLPLINKEETVVNAKGEELIFLTTKVPLPDENGQITGLVGIGHDITKSRRNEKIIHQNEINLRAIFESTDDAFMLVDKNNIIIQMNAKASITRPRGAAIGSNILDFIPVQRRVSFQESLNKAGKGEVVRYEIDLGNAGESKWYDVSISPVKDGEEVAGFCITAHDLSCIKDVEISLRESVGRFRAIVENSTDVFTVRDLHGSLLYASPNVTKVLGYDPDGFRELNPLDLIHPDHLDAYNAAFRRMAKRNGEQMELDIRMKHKDGGWIHVEGCVINLTEIDGIHGILSIFHDVTTRKEGEINILRLNNSLADFQNAIFQSSIVSRADNKGVITYANDNFVKISGYSLAELIGSNHRLINSGFHPKDFWIDMWKTIASGKIWRQDVKNKSRTGEYYWVDTFVMPFVNDEGIVTEFISIRNDITERKKAEEELYQNKLLLDKANEIANIGYWTYNPIKKETTWDDQTLRTMGLPADFKGGFQGYLRLIHPMDIDRVTDAMELTISTGQPFNIDHRIVFPDGAVRWLHEEAKVIHDEEDKVSMILGVVQDISERKSVEEILVGYNEKFELLSKATNDAIYDWDMFHNRETWSHGFPDIFGYEHLEIADVKSWQRNTIHVEDYYRIINDIDECVNQKRTNWTGTYRYKTSEGGYKHVLDRGYIIYHDKEAVRMIGALQDITQRVEATAEIEKLSLVASKASNAVTITDVEGRVEWVNNSFISITGYAFEEVKGRKLNFLQGPDTDLITVKKISEQLKRREAISVELINYRKNGEKFWLKLAITPVFNDEGDLKNFISIQSDISELKEFENSITSIARELTSLIENANVPIFGIDAQGNFNEWNHVTAELSGYARNEMIGTRWSEKLFVQSFAGAFAAMIETVLRGTPVGNLEMPLVTKNRNKLMLLLSASPRRNSKQEIIGVIIVAQNISELTEYRYNLEMKVRERTKALNEALNKERELVEMKSRFVSIASHEFRTPLATIAAATGLVRKHQSKLSAQEIQDKLLTVEKQVNHMSHMLDDVLLLDKANAGKMKVLKNEIDLHDFVKNLSQEVVVSRGNTHRVVVLENLILRTVMSDEKILRSILINLLTNAIKFSPRGGDVNVSIESAAGYFSIAVKDFGIGIPESDLKNLFEPFFRGENANTIQGTGLGLSIIKKSVDLLSGIIAVHSMIHEGTEFTITIPISDE